MGETGSHDFFSPHLRHQSPLSVSCRSPSLSEMPLGSVFGRRPTCHRNICTKVLLAEGAETPFTEHCRNYENTYRVSAARFTFLTITFTLLPRTTCEQDLKESAGRSARLYLDTEVL